MNKRINPAPFTITPGATPLLISVPHSGLKLLPGMEERLSIQASKLPDTDWCVDALYNWVTSKGVGLLVANYSRYVVDLNRPADDSSLYSNQQTGLFPQQTFAGEELWAENTQPKFSVDWIKENIWQAYHSQIQAELQRLRQKFGYAVLLDAHSIAAEVPSLFSGKLPDLNLGSFAGKSADSGLIKSVWKSLESTKYSRVLDGRFKGGAITRSYGKPKANIHALQLELSQATYLNTKTTPPKVDPTRVPEIQIVLGKMVEAILGWRDFTHA